MKKILLSIICIYISTTVTAQITDYVSGLNAPERLLISGNLMYVKGESSISVIDISSSTPTALQIASVGANQYISNFTISGNMLYLATESILNDEFVESTISRIDLTNVGAGAEIVIDGLDYVSALTISGNNLYYSSELESSPEVFVTYLNKIDVSAVTPTPVVMLSGFTIVEDMEIRNNILYASDRDEHTIYSIDTLSDNPTLEVFSTGLNFNRGLFVHNEELYVSDGNQIKKGSFSATTPAPMTVVGANTTYSDSNNGNPFYANFRDVVLSGNVMYMALSNQGKVVTMVDSTLSRETHSVDNLQIINAGDLLTIAGLNSSQNIKIYNISGQEVYTATIDVTRNAVDISSLATGLHIMKFESGTGYKFIK